MREVDGWRFLGYYGILYLIIMIVVVASYPLQSYTKPIASLIFPIAENGSLLKSVIVTTLMYWSAILFYTLVIQKIRPRF